MPSKRAVIGTTVGIIILLVGAASFITNLGLREFIIDDTYQIDDPISPFTLRAPEGTIQHLDITAESFDTLLRTPNEEQAVSHTDNAALEWVHDQEAVSNLQITNTGAGSLSISGTLYSETDWVFITYNFFVMISGLIIVGFSAGFGKRKPRGF